MKKIILLLSISVVAQAQEWSGVYIGPNLGAILNRTRLDAQHIALSSWDGQCDQKTNFSSAFVGGQAGVSKQFESNWVLGVEGDYTYHFTQSSLAQCVCDFNANVYDNFNVSNRYQASVKGRLAYALPHNMLPFFAAGISFAKLGTSYDNEVAEGYSYSSMQPGFVVGGGLDWSFASKWSLRLEYYYDQYNTLNMALPIIYGILDSSGQTSMNLSSNNIRAGVNYWF